MDVKIIMLSGGYDSTGLLFWALKNINWQIHIHHIELINAEKRWKQENKSIDEILKYLKDNNYKFEYSNSKIENNNPWYCEKDIINVGFIGASIAKAIYYENRKYRPVIEVFTGGTLEDNCQKQIDNMDGIGKKNAIFDILFCDWPSNLSKPTISIPFISTPKIELVKYIPKELLNFIWTCREPKIINGISYECKTCISCKRKMLMHNYLNT